MIAEQAPELADVLATGTKHGWTFICLDGTLIQTTRSHAKSAAGHDLWYSGKHHQHGGNIQVVTDPRDSRYGPHRWNQAPPTTSPPPAHTSCPPCTRPSRTASQPWPTRDTPAPGSASMSRSKGRDLEIGNRATNQVITALRAPAERANALLKTTWKALARITVCPWRIGNIVTAALVLLTMQRGRWSENLSGRYGGERCRAGLVPDLGQVVRGF